MNPVPAYLLLLLPLLSAVVVGLFLRRTPKLAGLISIAACAASLVAAVAFAFQNDGVIRLFQWIEYRGFDWSITARIDDLSRGMMLVVTIIGLMVQVYSVVYMKDDESYARYYAGLSLFMFSMTGIVLANNLGMIFLFWELVGVSSYLLIGHWFKKDSASAAANKAFIANRIGDWGFIVGLGLVWILFQTFTFQTPGEVDGLEARLTQVAETHPVLLTLAALALFCGAVGKSAQLPLHVWLPDAMEGPTPVSALIHAATMVAAGVYLLLRISFVLVATPVAQVVILWVGLLTALLAALIATQQNDIKKILAYSTLSQLGYMVMAIGLLVPEAAQLHLFTHAFFKALLFLGAGAVIYACHHEQDIWKMGGLRHKMPVTFQLFLYASLSLAALPWVTSGFFSKEQILHAALAYQHDFAVPIFAVIVAFLTPFYMTRLVVVAFLGSPRSENAEHAHEVPWGMRLPLLVLGVLSTPIALWLAHATGWLPEHLHLGLGGTMISLILVLAGVLVAFKKYSGRDSEPKPIKLLINRFGFDELYDKLIQIFVNGASLVVKAIDQLVIDGLFNRGLSRAAIMIGDGARRLQSGNLQTYSIVGGAGLMILIYLLAS